VPAGQTDFCEGVPLAVAWVSSSELRASGVTGADALGVAEGSRTTADAANWRTLVVRAAAKVCLKQARQIMSSCVRSAIPVAVLESAREGAVV
jgi:hypothetical protein